MLEAFALFAICLSITAIFYLFILIHDLPHHLAKKRGHPQTEAIHAACWLSLFTLHAIWPLVFIWSLMAGKPPEGSKGSPAHGVEGSGGQTAELKKLRETVSALESRLKSLEASRSEASRG